MVVSLVSWTIARYIVDRYWSNELMNLKTLQSLSAGILIQHVRGWPYIIKAEKVKQIKLNINLGDSETSNPQCHKTLCYGQKY